MNNETIEDQDIFVNRMEIKPELILLGQVNQARDCLRMRETENNLNSCKAFFVMNVNVLEGMAKEFKGVLPTQDIVDTEMRVTDKSYDTLIEEYKLSTEYKSSPDPLFHLAVYKLSKLFGFISANQPQHSALRMGR